MNDLVNILCDLVRIDSITGSEHKLAKHLVAILKDQVDFIKIDNYGNVYARINGLGEPLFLSAHMDTVEPGKDIKPIVKNNLIQSDGSTILGGDNKIALACIIKLVQSIHREKLNTRPLELIFTRSEEVGNYGAVNFDYSLLQASTGFCFDSATPVGTIISASPYYERITIDLVGKAAHASLPEKGVNALLILNSFLNSIKLGRIDQDTLFNIGVISGGDVRNTIPEKITLEAEIRSFRKDKLIHCRQVVESVLKNVSSQYGIKYNLKFVLENGGYKLSKKNPLIKETSGLIKAMDIKTSIKQLWTVSDANIFHDHNLNCLNLGDGLEFAHTTKERISLSELKRLYQLMSALVRA